MVELNEQQQQLIDAGSPALVIDPRNHEKYFLVHAASFERLRPLLGLDSNWTDETFRAAMDVFGREGWNDPAMDVYDALDPRRQA